MSRKLFDSRGKPHGRVILHYHGDPEKELTRFAEAFHLAAKETVAALRQDPNFGHDSFDFRPYPVVFLYRHALEQHPASRGRLPVLLAPLQAEELSGSPED